MSLESALLVALAATTVATLVVFLFALRVIDTTNDILFQRGD